MILLEAKQALARKLGIDYSDIANNDLFSEADLEFYVIQGAMQAYDFQDWDFAEHAKTATLESTDITNGYIELPDDILSSSIFYFAINGEEYDKKNFRSYKKYFEENATATEKYWSEFKRMIFFNANSCSAGDVVDVYGKQKFRVPETDSDLLPFSPNTDNEESSGNYACVLLAFAEALGSDQKKEYAQSRVEHEKALFILQSLSNQLKQGRASEQNKNRPMFDVPDMFRGRSGGGSNIGTFSQ
jgi:hypothetical protein